MKLMSVDQSLSHCAVVIWAEDSSVPEAKYVIRTGSTSSTGKRDKDVVYFDTTIEQIMYITGTICALFDEHKPDTYVMESLSLASIGNATRDLAGLFFCIQAALVENYLSVTDLHEVAPTSVKAFARKFLPEEEQTYIKERFDKKKDKMVESVAKTEMKKAQIVQAAEIAEPGWLSGMTLKAGKADLADAYFIGRVFLSKQEAKSQ